ncbi:MAG: exodeoxyribonuclease VII large subunit [Clostridiaceae bacterium]|nr:exodeoxyribonuclease VII large subunit [Clostridiaceae bacterium]
MEIKTLSVSQVNSYIKRLLTNDPILYNISVKGEISNFKLHSSGHMYFTIKDDNSRISCIMFKSNGEKLKEIPYDGMNIVAKGYISLYERDGLYQLYVNELEATGLGDLYIKYQQLKDSLEKEGLFDKSKKKSIPYIPKKIGIITSPTGAAIRDIISVIKRRFPNVEMYIFPVLVQGEKSAASIAKAIDECNGFQNIEVIIVGRGGGSIEELWAFNEEVVARAIYKSKIPVISAVGHETDFTIADFVADIRANTPSAAAELVVPRLVDVIATLNSLNKRLLLSINTKINTKQEQLNAIKNNYHFKYPLNYIYDEKQHLDESYKRLCKITKQNKDRQDEKLRHIVEKLNNLNPLSIFSRGYAIVENDQNNTVKSIEDINEGDTLNINLLDGKATAKVLNITKEDMSLEKR